jgi:putative endonuclease
LSAHLNSPSLGQHNIARRAAGARAAASQALPSVTVVTATGRSALGRHGEDLAAAHLRALGFSLIAQNVRLQRGEIDLIAFNGSTLVFAEVKTRRIGTSQRTPRADQRPLDGLGPRQRGRLRRLAAAWLADEQRSRPFAETIRFDAIGVVLDAGGRLRRIEHVEDAW